MTQLWFLVIVIASGSVDAESLTDLIQGLGWKQVDVSGITEQNIAVNIFKELKSIHVATRIWQNNHYQEVCNLQERHPLLVFNLLEKDSSFKSYLNCLAQRRPYLSLLLIETKWLSPSQM